MSNAQEALQRLQEGNRRYVAGEGAAPTVQTGLAAGQSPFAVILGCSDSRVPVEVVFDQGPGDLFVVRVAGSVASRSAVGSIEFGVENLGACLVVVLGHTGCGAVQATLDDIERPCGFSPGLQAIVDLIRPSVESLPPGESPVRGNVRGVVEQLRRGSQTLARAIQRKGVEIVGAEYDLATGVVSFL